MKFLRVHLPATNDDGTKAWVDDGYSGERLAITAYRQLWDRFSRDWLENLFRVIHSYYKSAQYDQVPSMGELAYFLMTDQIPRWSSPQVQFWWMGIDAANTATAAGAETALVAVGILGRRLKVLGARSGKWRQDTMATEALSFASDMTRLTGLGCERCLIERAAGGYGLLERLEGQLRIEPVTPLGSKEDRAGDVCFLVNQLQVEFPAAPSQGVLKLEQQLRDFPLCNLKDLVDAFVHCLKFTQGTSELKAKHDDHNILLLSDPVEEILSGQHDGPSSAFQHGPLEEDMW